jgi:hypothetical protein
MKVILLIFVAFVNITFGQDLTSEKNRELYLTLADFSPLNIHLKYKKQIKEHTYLKFGLVNLSGSHSKSSSDNSVSSYSAGIEMGIEFRKTLTNEISFFHGPNIRYTYQMTTNKFNADQKNSIENHGISIPYSLGILYNLTSHLLLSAEINPSLTFSHAQVKNDQILPNSTSNGVNFSLDNRYGSLSLVFRF